MQFLIDKGIAIAVWLLAMAAQVSGYNNVAIALGLIGLAVFFLVPPIVHHTRAWQKRIRARPPKRRGRMYQMIPIIGILVSGFAFTICGAWIVYDNRRANQEISNALSRYVLPRHLSEDQIAKIGEYLRKFEPQKFNFLVTPNNEEASSYRADIQRALTEGGWELETIDYSDKISQGISMQTRMTQASSQAKPDPKRPRADTMLQNAFKDAKVQLSGLGSGSGTEDSFTINVGARRTDDSDLKRSAYMRERALQTLKETEE
jgi:hypothetical protein